MTGEPAGHRRPLRVALISLHTSPLAQPGTGDSGGMNVYVREVAASLAQSGVECTTYTRADRPGPPPEVLVEPGHRVVHLSVGEYDLPKEALAELVDDFADAAAADIEARGGVDVVHANYWLSGVAGHRIKHRFDLPLVSTFHTLARVKAEGGDLEPSWRDHAEAEIVACADVICVSCDAEERQFRRLYDRPNGAVEIVPPAVDHAFFAPGDQAGARRATGLPLDRPVVTFVGRLQPLKGPDVVVAALAEMTCDDAVAVIVGGASGPDGEAMLHRLEQLVVDHGLENRVRFVDPQPHHLLSAYYRSADVVVVPSRSESFGLVALEAAACGVPVVAAAVGGLVDVVVDGSTGVLVDDRRPAAFARALDELIADPRRAAEIGRAAARHAAGYTWSVTAAKLRRVYHDLAERRIPLVTDCR